MGSPSMFAARMWRRRVSRSFGYWLGMVQSFGTMWIHVWPGSRQTISPAELRRSKTFEDIRAGPRDLLPPAVAEDDRFARAGELHEELRIACRVECVLVGEMDLGLDGYDVFRGHALAVRAVQFTHAVVIARSSAWPRRTGSGLEARAIGNGDAARRRARAEASGEGSVVVG